MGVESVRWDGKVWGENMDIYAYDMILLYKLF